MAQTQIEWTWRLSPISGLMLPGYSFNGWIGCTAVSRACRLCYADAQDDRRFSRTLGGATAEMPIRHFGKGAPRYRTQPENWKKPLQWDRQAQKAGVALAVFCSSLSDWADEEVPDTWRDDLLELIDKTPNLDWLMLTKRPAKARSYLKTRGCPGNVWMGATMEDQATFNARIGDLLAIEGPAKYFASMEPIFDAVDITKGLRDDRALDWVITGGESNHDDRAKSFPTHPDDFHQVAAQCWAAGVPFFFKQWGDWAPAYALDHNPQAQAMCVTGKVRAHDFGRGEGGRRVVFNVGKAAAGSTFEGEQRRQTPPVRLLN